MNKAIKTILKSCLVLLLFLAYLKSYSQKDNIKPDSIEYCWWSQIYDFKISNNQYYFSDFNLKNIIETDSLIFNPVKYFDNFHFKTDYVDSVRFAIVSRTLRFYKESILYNYSNPFIRFVWLKYNTPILITLFIKNDSTFVIYKETNGSLDIHGRITEQKSKFFPLDLINKSLKKIEKSDFFNLKHGIGFCHNKDSMIYFPNLFIEVFDGKRYNIIILDECNLDYDKFKFINKTRKYILKRIK